MGDPEPQVGRVLDGKYRLDARLGEGGFGSIWRAEHLVLHAPVAVKLIHVEGAQQEGLVERFLREAQATAALRSPHVVQLLDYGADEQQPYIVMELLEGENLAERLKRVGFLTPTEVVRIVTHVARAIGRAHELGVIHRDLKPENVFLVRNGDEEIAKVLDFGVAKMVNGTDQDQGTRTRTGSLIGTPHYMSPEQAQGNKAVDFRTDLWALGVMAFEMLTGQRPFDSDGLGDLVLSICIREIPVPSQIRSVPQGFDAWFARAVQRDPELRYQSARDMATDLMKVVGGERGEARYTILGEGSWPETSANGPSSSSSPAFPPCPPSVTDSQSGMTRHASESPRPVSVGGFAGGTGMGPQGASGTELAPPPRPRRLGSFVLILVVAAGTWAVAKHWFSRGDLDQTRQPVDAGLRVLEPLDDGPDSVGIIGRSSGSSPREPYPAPARGSSVLAASRAASDAGPSPSAGAASTDTEPMSDAGLEPPLDLPPMGDPQNAPDGLPSGASSAADASTVSPPASTTHHSGAATGPAIPQSTSSSERVEPPEGPRPPISQTEPPVPQHSAPPVSDSEIEP